MKFRHSDGFSLLEIMLAVSLLALITTSIMGGVHLGRRSWETSRASDTLDEVDTTARVIVDLIGKSFIVTPDQAMPDLQGPPITFTGALDSCRIVVLSEGGAQWGGLIVTQIGVEDGPNGLALVVWSKPYHPRTGLSVDRANMTKTILADGLVSIKFGYFGVTEPIPGQLQTLPPSWSDTWRSVSSLPELVSVTLVLRRLGRDMESTATVALHQQ